MHSNISGVPTPALNGTWLAGTRTPLLFGVHSPCTHNWRARSKCLACLKADPNFFDGGIIFVSKNWQLCIIGWKVIEV